MEKTRSGGMHGLLSSPRWVYCNGVAVCNSVSIVHLKTQPPPTLADVYQMMWSLHCRLVIRNSEVLCNFQMICVLIFACIFVLSFWFMSIETIWVAIWLSYRDTHAEKEREGLLQPTLMPNLADLLRYWFVMYFSTLPSLAESPRWFCW